MENVELINEFWKEFNAMPVQQRIDWLLACYKEKIDGDIQSWTPEQLRKVVLCLKFVNKMESNDSFGFDYMG